MIDPARDDQLDLRARRRHGLVHDRPPYVQDGNVPDPTASASRSGSTRSTRATRHPRTPPSRSTADGGPTPFTADDEVLLRVGLQARPVAARDRQQASLTFVIDTSGSMAREDRLELVKDALRILVDGLGRNDRVAIVTFGSDAAVVLGPTRRPTTSGDPRRHRRPHTGRLDERRGRAAARLSARPSDA